jgi:hypothetical protein
MFEHILNWKLLKGSHEFPGSDGGTCINEAALIAAGFKYKAIRCTDDCPPCFSRVISAYAIGLNDRMPDKLRQKLLIPFVTRLAGTADRPEVENKRLESIVMRTKLEILPFACTSAYAYADAAYAAANAASANAAAAIYASVAAAYASAAANAASANASADAASAKERIWTIAVSILDEAIRLGKQAEPVETALVIERMERAKVNA